MDTYVWNWMVEVIEYGKIASIENPQTIDNFSVFPRKYEKQNIFYLEHFQWTHILFSILSLFTLSVTCLDINPYV